MGLRAFVPLVAACPGCGRTSSTYFQELAESIQGYVRDQMITWREQYVGCGKYVFGGNGLCSKWAW